MKKENNKKEENEIKKSKRVRSVVIDLNITFNDPALSEEQRKEKKKEIKSIIRKSIKLYRSVGRKIFTGAILARMAGAEIKSEKEDIKISPNTSASNDILNLSFNGNFKKGPLYGIKPYIKELAPTWLSFVSDSVRRDIDNALKRKDPEFPKASRDWLTLNGARGIGWFKNLGIAFPIATARPKLYNNKISLKWDHNIGEIEFTVPKLDRGRYLIWKSIRDKEYKLGTLFLNEKDNKLRAVISYEMPDKKVSAPDKNKVLIIEFKNDPEEFITMSVDNRGKVHNNVDKISIIEAINWAQELKIQQNRFLSHRRSVGSPRFPWGSRKISKGIKKRQNNITARTENGKKYRNHLWTRRIAQRAEKFNVGSVILIEPPENTLFEATENETPWQMYQFKQFLKYKLDEIDVTLLEA